jgi:RNA polymerase sigma factor (sigma-70 family)
MTILVFSCHHFALSVMLELVLEQGAEPGMSLVSKKETNNSLRNLGDVEEIFTEHGDFVRSIIRFHVRNEVEREDLFQDFFLWLISKPVPQDVQNVRGYIYRVVYDDIKDAFRRIERYQKRVRRYAEHRKRIIENRPRNSQTETEEAEKMFELIRKRLPKKEALAITLRYHHNYDTATVAKTMGIEPKSASRYISAATKKLRQVFDVSGRNRHDSV